MPQGKSDQTALLLVGGAVLLFFFLRSRQAGAGALDLSITGPGPEPLPSATVGPAIQPFQPGLRLGPTGGVVQPERQPLLGTQIIEGAISALERPGAGIGTALVRPQQPKPQFIPVSEFERRFPRGIVQQRTGAEQFGEAVLQAPGQIVTGVQQFFGGLFR